MPDNTTLDPGVDGDEIRTLLRGSVKTPISLLDQGGTGAESLVDATHPLRVSIVGAGGGVLTSLPVDVATLPPAEPLPAGTNNIGDVDVLTMPGLTGNVAHDAADSGNPVKTGGKARATLPAVVQDLDRVDAYYDLRGRLGTFPSSHPAATGNVATPAANAAAVVTFAAGGAGVSHSISGVFWSYNADPTGGNLKIEDGAGTVVFSIDITTKGPGFIPFPEPLRGTPNTAMILTLAAAGAGVSGKCGVLSRRSE